MGKDRGSYTAERGIGRINLQEWTLSSWQEEVERERELMELLADWLSISQDLVLGVLPRPQGFPFLKKESRVMVQGFLL